MILHWGWLFQFAQPFDEGLEYWRRLQDEDEGFKRILPLLYIAFNVLGVYWKEPVEERDRVDAGEVGAENKREEAVR